MLCAQTPADDPPQARFVDSDAETLLEGDDLRPESDEGHIQLYWSLRPAADGDEPDGPPEFRLTGRLGGEVASDSVVYYQGPQSRSFISGLEDGEHTFVVQARYSEADAWGPESEPLVLDVEHHPLSRSFTLLGIGVLLFIAIVFVVVREAITARDPFKTDEQSDGQGDAEPDPKQDPIGVDPPGGGA